MTKNAQGSWKRVQPLEVEVAAVHDVERAGLGNQPVKDVDVVQLAVADVRKLGMLPRRSSSVCSLIAALVDRKTAHGNTSGTIDGREVQCVDLLRQGRPEGRPT